MSCSVQWICETVSTGIMCLSDTLKAVSMGIVILYVFCYSGLYFVSSWFFRSLRVNAEPDVYK